MKNRIFTRLLPILLLTLISMPALAMASGVPTCPQISWEAQRQLVSNWAQTGSLTPSESDWITGGSSQSSVARTTDTSNWITCGSGTISGSASCTTNTSNCATGTSATCPTESTATCPNGTAGCTSTSATCPGGTSTCPTGSTATCPNGTAGCTSTSATCPGGTSTCPTDATPTTPADGTSSQNDGHYTPGSPTAQEIALYNEINAERVARGLDALPLDTSLSQLARLKSQDMAENHYFAHESPTYGTAAEMLTDAGYPFNGVGENIAHAGSVQQAHNLLMSSDGHRRNILGSQWTKVGIGIVNDSNGYPLVTELFAR